MQVSNTAETSGCINGIFGKLEHYCALDKRANEEEPNLKDHWTVFPPRTRLKEYQFGTMSSDFPARLGLKAR